MKRLFIVVRSISFDVGIGGMEKAAKQHLDEMYSVGYQIFLVAPKDKVIGRVPEYVTLIDVPWPKWDKYKVLMTMGFAYLQWCKSVAKVLKNKVQVNDVLHMHGASAGALQHINNSILEETITTVNPHGMEEFGSGSVFRLINRIFTRKLVREAKKADIVIATDVSLVDVVKKNINIDSDKICVIPNTIDIRKLRRLANKGAECGNQELKIVSVGRIEYNKGYDILAESLINEKFFSLINNKYKWIHFGKGKMKNELQSFCIKNNINLEIRSNSTDSEVQTSIANSDIFIQPSRYEGSSLTTLEAMTHGALIVAMPVGGIPDKIYNNITGFLSEDVTSSALAESIIQAIKCKNKNEIKNSAMTYVEDNFDIDISTKKYNELYNKLSVKKGLR
ncbi:glycosyltransferase family 4 protein [Klebsiella huaxiensis]|uniref:glycosyltransferase family 4 protein n=1 Tax=Klebsiella huaxiensis TaxID=2153354 RepID=UPI00315E7ACB